MRQVQSELDTLARLHAAVRHGQPSLAKQVQIRGGRRGIVCSLAPDATAAAGFWNDNSRQISGVHMFCQAPEDSVYSGTWLQQASSRGSPRTQGSATYGWGQRYFGLLYKRPERGSGLSAQLFDCHKREWMPRQLVDDSLVAAVNNAHCIQFSDDESLAAGVVTGLELAPEALVIFGVQVPSVSFAPATVCAFRCLPGTTSLLVVGRGCLARLDLRPDSLPPTGLLQLRWSPAPAAVSCSSMCLDLIPGASAAVLLTRCLGRSAAQASIHLCVYDTVSLCQVGSRRYEP